MAQDQIVDVSQPSAFAEVMQQEGYKAALKKNKQGETYLESAAGGSTFTVSILRMQSGEGLRFGGILRLVQEEALVRRGARQSLERQQAFPEDLDRR
ncbi:hypothetical protein [Sphingomonas sp. KR3-1]|uniref:hypothetical protein n=1 Tax=Sphingomonas sp. KR3-1 TaxID=3156611 RepID=UPI0032B37D60